MRHIRIDNQPLNSQRKFACGIGPEIPQGDDWVYGGESFADYADCPRCNPGGPRQIGTPISQLSGQPGHPGYENFKRIASSWGYD